MTDKTQPEALRLADALASNYFDGKQGRDVWDAASSELRRQHARIAELEAQIEAVGAGGVQPLSLQKPTQAIEEQARAATKSIAHGGKITRHSDMSVLVTFHSCRQASAFEQAIKGEAPVWQDHAKAMERERDYWRERARTMLGHQQGECWYWQGDGHDNLHSLINSLPVVIRADQLRELVAAAPANQAQEAINSGAKAVPVVWLSGKQLNGITAIHGSYLPFRHQREGRFDTPVYLEAAAPQAAPTYAADPASAGRFTKKPVTISAIQWTGKNLREVIAFTDGPPDTRSTHAGMAWDAYRDLVARDGLKIYTLEGKMLASPGDWIIRGVKGELYPCKPDIFAATYEAVPQPEAPQAAPSPTTPKPGERCQHCIDRNDGFYGSYAPDCPYHDDHGNMRAAPQAAPAVDTQIVDWLQANYIGPDFAYGEPATSVIVIEVPNGFSATGDLRGDVGVTLAAQGGAS